MCLVAPSPYQDIAVNKADKNPAPMEPVFKWEREKGGGRKPITNEQKDIFDMRKIQWDRMS